MAGPLLKYRIELGNVRITNLNHTKYQLQQCNYFYSPSNPWLNYYYWNDYDTTATSSSSYRMTRGEFISGQDSDFILTIQKDVILCTILDVYAWREYSYVGAPWPALPTWWSCTQLIANWNYWHSMTTITTKTIRDGRHIPSYPTQQDFSNNPNIGPIGNGGFSLRSRYWIQQAIQYCPDEILSGLDNVASTKSVASW